MRGSSLHWQRRLIGVLLAAAGMPWSVGAQQDSPAPAGEAASEQPRPARGDGGVSGELETEESLGRYEQLLQRRPFHGPALDALVSHYARQGKLQELVEQYESRAESLPDDASVRIVLARLKLRAGDAAGASEVLESLGDLGPEGARMEQDLLVLRAEVYQRSGDDAGAEQMLTRALGLARSISDRQRLTEALADLYLRGGRQDDAIKALRELGAQFPDNYLHQRRIADAMAQRGLHAAAAEQYRAMLALVGEEVDRRCEVLRDLGQCLEKTGKRDEAIAAYVEAIGLLASDHWLQKDLHERVVALYRAAGRLEDLAAYCEGQIKRAPEQTAMRILLADVQAAMGKPEEGKRTLAAAVELFPRDLRLSQKVVEYLERLGDIEGASAEYQRAIGQHPQDAELYIAYGQLLASNRQVESARNQWRHVLATRVDDTSLATRLGALFETYELYDDAAEAYERAVALSPATPEPYAALSRLWMVRGEPERALAALERMGSANPSDASVQAALAQLLRNLGKTDEALAAITRACELMPGQVRHHQVRAELLVEAGRLEEALAVRRDTIGRMPNAVQQAEAVATLVSMHASAGKLDDLRRRETARLDEDPGDAVALLILARAADTERDFAGARQYLERLLEVQPGSEPALRQMAKLHDAMGDADGAVEIYLRLAQLHPERARQFYEAIVDLNLRYGDRAGAIGTLERMAAADPGNASTLNAVAEQLARMGEAERAIGYYQTSLRLQPDRHEVRLDYGKALADAGRLEEAMREFRAVATQRTDTDRAVEALGRLHDTASQLGMLEDLIDDLRREVEADPSATLVARALAQLLIHELEYGQAMDLLDLVLRHNPRDVDLQLGRAELLRRLARFEEAAEAYQRVLRFPQIDRDYVLGELGKTWFEAGQIDQARRLWRQIQHRLYAGTLLKNNGLVEEGIEVFREGIRLKPDDFALHRNLIGALEAAGRTDEALEAARRLLDLEPANVWNIERLAEAHLRRGDRAGAAAVASRLFSASVGPDQESSSGGQGAQYQQRQQTFLSAMYQAATAQWGATYSWGGQGPRSNLDRGVDFFLRNGLRAELEAVLTEQLAAQPQNASLKKKAADLYEAQLGKPEAALALLRDLETAEFPIEQQQWLGQCSQRDFMRIRQYNLIATKPALRDAELAALEAKPAQSLTRDELIELAVIRSAQGNAADAADLLGRAVEADGSDTLARGLLVDLLVGAERFAEAEPHARVLVEALGREREAMQAGMIERVRRDFVRSLPLEQQLRVTEDLLADIADKWTLGSAWGWWVGSGMVQTTGYLRAKMTLGTILAETGRMEEARAVWEELAPRRGPDVDRWTMLGDVAQVHKQEDAAYRYYRGALEAARRVAGDPLLQQIYASTATMQAWYGEGAVDSTFNSIVAAFAERNNLLELYDFLRDTDQESRAKRLAEQYDLGPALKERMAAQVAEAREAFLASPDDPLRASVPYFAKVCKLAELYDREGDWEGARRVYTAYLADFPDELGLLKLLGEVASARLETAEAIAWEREVLECKARLARRGREWRQRELTLTPSCPKALGAEARDTWSWSMRWRRSVWGYRWGRDELDRGASWMRLAQLYLADGNTIAAADAMQQAVAEAGASRGETIRQVVNLIQRRQLTAQMLPVLRTLAVYAPSDERVQLAFSEALEAAGRREVAVEVCNRMLRRGVSDLGVLAEVRRRVQSLSPEEAPEEATLASLEAEAAADPANLRTRLRLAKAYFYSLEVAKAAEILAPLAQEAPHLEDVHDLLVESYTLLGEQDKLIEALKAKIERISDDRERQTARWRLVDELLTAGRTEEAIALVRDLGDPKDPSSYVRVATLLHYFGLHEEAIERLEQVGKSRSARPWGRSGADFSVAQSLALRGDVEGAADRILEAIAEQAGQQVQYGGMYGFYESSNNPFAQVQSLLVLEPRLAEALSRRLEAQQEAKPRDPQVIKLRMALHDAMGRPDLAEKLLEQVAGEGATDQTLVLQLIDLAVARREYARAVELAQRFIAQQPKPMLPPGVPPQYGAYMVMQSPRTFMVCKLGDLYWDMGEREKAFEAYEQIVDKKMDLTRVAYAGICMLRGRVPEARKLVDAALAAQKVKPAYLLRLRAFIAAAEGDVERAYDCLAQVAAMGDAEDDDPIGMGGGQSGLKELGVLAQRAGMFDRFVEFVRGRIAKDPQEWENYDVLAEAYRDAGRPDEALAVLDEAERISSLAQRALAMRLSWRRTCAPVEELVALYRRLIEISDKSVQSEDANPYGYRWGGYQPAREYRDQLGNLLWDLGRREEAERAWSERLSPQEAETHLKLGRLYREREEYDAARRSFERALELDPDNTTAHLALAQEAAARGDRRALLEHMLELFVRQQNDREIAERMYAWAAALAGDSELSSYLADGGENPRAREMRVMLAALTGDWVALEGLLRGPIEAGTHDPLTWRLWADLQQRRGNWKEAAAALDYLRRAQRTTIGEHRDKLRLVLAGKQLKEAAGGTRQAQPTQGPAGGSGYSSSYYGGYYYGYDDYYSPSADTLLPSMYVRLGDYERAERLYLISAASGYGTQSLPALASVMWEQGARERALELMRLALVLGGGRAGSALLTQYASMLAEAGRAEEAAALLARAYRWRATRGQDVYALMWGDNSEAEFEHSGEATLSKQLYETLARSGRAAEFIRALEAEAAADPTDTRLAKLILSLRRHARQWGEVRDALAALSAARPHDPAVRLERLHTECQLGRWDEALATLKQVRRNDPDNADRWDLYEAFIRLMKGEDDRAVEAVARLAGPDVINSRAPDLAVPTVLAAARRLDRLAEYLERQRNHGEIDAVRTDLLVRTWAALGRWNDALTLAADELWKTEEAISASSPWYATLCWLSSSASASGVTLSPPAARPADAALLTLLREGPEAGLRAFAALAAQDEPSLEALRGLVLAATLAGDSAAAAQANARLLAWLAPRRFEAWHTKPGPSAQRIVLGALERMQRHGVATTVLNGSALGSLAQAVDNLGGAGGVVLYDNLWRAHQRMHRGLLAAAASSGELEALMRSQERTLEDPDNSASDDAQLWMYGGVVAMGGTYTQVSDRAEEESDHQWRAGMRSILRRAGRMDALAAEYARLGERTPQDEWAPAGEAAAAMGKNDEAARWRRRAAEEAISRLCATSKPQAPQGRWSWWHNTFTTRDTGTIRAGLAAELAAPTPRQSPVRKEMDEVWEFALADPVIEGRLLACEPLVAPGTGATPLLEQLVQYHRARENGANVIELLERAMEPEALARGKHLGDYLWACHASKDAARVERLLERIAALGREMENDVALARLVLLRVSGRGGEADALEAQLVERCAAETVNPRPLPAEMRQADHWNQHDEKALTNRLTTAASLAALLGVRFEPRVADQDVTLTRIRETYERSGLHRDAARIAALEAAAATTPEEKWQAMAAGAVQSAKAGEKDAASRTARELEAQLLDAIKESPADAALRWALADLYMSDAFGPDFARALEATREARRFDPTRPDAAAREVHCLYKLGRHREAWEAWRIASACEAAEGKASEPMDAEPTIFYAAISACRAGEVGAGAALARRAMFRYPLHDLAAQAAEAIHESE